MSVSGNLLTIVRATDFAEDFVVQVNVSDGAAADSESFAVSVANSAPQLSPVGDQTMSRNQLTLTVPLSASDADGDPLTYSLQASAVDPLAQQAYDLDQRYGLYQWEGSFWTNLRGQNEKYIASTANGVQHPLFILPNGDLYLWDTSIADSTRIATLSAAYYADPFLLCNAQSPGNASLTGGEVQLSVSGGALTITRAAYFTEDFFVQVSVSDGAAADSESFAVSVANSAPQLSPVGDQTMSSSQLTLTVPLSARTPTAIR